MHSHEVMKYINSVYRDYYTVKPAYTTEGTSNDVMLRSLTWTDKQ